MNIYQHEMQNSDAVAAPICPTCKTAMQIFGIETDLPAVICFHSAVLNATTSKSGTAGINKSPSHGISHAELNMPEYRFYAIKHDGHVAGPPKTYDAPDDRAALAEAKKLVNGHDVEVWQGARVVAYLTSDR